MKKNITLFLCCLLTMALGTNTASAQTYNITSSPNSGMPPGGYLTTYPTTSGTLLIAGSQSSNQWSPVQTLPFPFYFYGNLVTQFKVSGNGVLTFDVNSSILPGANTAIPTALLPDSSIAFLWDDFSTTASNDVVRTQTYGTAPNRQQWIWYYSYQIGSPMISFAYFAVVLEETTNNIYVADMYNGTPLTSGTTVGVQLNSTTGVMDALSPSVLRGSNGTGVADDDLWTFVFTSPCSSPPNAGSAVASNPTPCLGQTITLDLNVNTSGISGQTYQWESAPTLAGPWTLEGTSQASPQLSVAPPVGTTYYRAQVTCGASTVPSIEVAVVVPTPYPGGNYTINSALPTGGGNFQSFTDAMSAIGCGISGPVVFDVAPGSGPYTEQIIMPNTIGSSAASPVTINGNGATVQYSATAASTAMLMMDGVDYVKIDSLIFKSLNASMGSGAMLYNNCDRDTITRCTFDLTSVTGTASTNFGIRIATTPTTTSTTLSGASNTLISGCKILGNPAGNNGIYYGLYAYGPNNNNVYAYNTISNCYLYSGYVYYGDPATITNNHITRQTKTGTGYCYGLVANSLTAGSRITKNHIEYLGGAANNASYSYPLQVLSNVGTSASPVLVANNVVNNMTSVPLNGGIYVTGSYVDVYHNTVQIDLPLTYSSTSTQSGIYNGSTTANIVNNLVSYKGGAPNTKYGLYYSSTPASSNYNNVYMNSSVAGAQHYGYRTSAHSTLSAFQTATGLEANGLDFDPGLVSSGGLPIPTSAAMDNMGTPLVAVPDDITGMLRPGPTPDMGAVEYVPPTCPPASTPTVTNTTTTTAALGWTANPTTTLWEIEYAQGNTFAVGTGIREIAFSNPYVLGTVTPLQPSTQYTYFVREICGANDTSLWSSRSPLFTTVATCDTPTAPIFSSVTASGADLDWTENGTATQWEIEYGLGTAFALGTGTRIIVNSKPYTLNPPLAQGTTYSYFVRSICGPADSSIWSARSAGFTTLVSCPAPTNIGFANITGTSVDVTWTATTGTEILEYGPTGHVPGMGATAGPGGTIVTNATSPYTITGLNPATGYDVFIRQDCSASSNGFSANLARNTSTTGAPVNDTICGALDVPLNSPNTVWVNTTNATVTATDPTVSGCTTPNNSAWFKFTTTSAGVYTITAYASQVTSYSTYYGNMSAWMWLYSSAGSCPTLALTEIAHLTMCMTGFHAPAVYPVPQNASKSYATPSLAANSTYYFIVDGADGSYGNIGFQVTTPLNVKLDKIAARNIGSTNVVEWNTVAEEAGDKFELERSTDGRNFSRIYQKPANGVGSNYSYIDYDAAKGINYYRLRMTEANGITIYSEIVSAIVNSGGFEVEAFPNPVSHDLTVRVSGVQGADATVQITDLTGKVVRTLKMDGAVQTINLASLANGLYLVKYSDANHTQTIKVNKQ